MTSQLQYVSLHYNSIMYCTSLYVLKTIKKSIAWQSSCLPSEFLTNGPVLVGTSVTTLATAGGRPPCSGNANANFFGTVPAEGPARPVRFDVGLEIHFSASSHLDGVGRENGGSNAATAVDLFTVGGPDELLSESKLSSSGARFLDLWPLLLDISVEVEHSRLPVDVFSIQYGVRIRELVLSKW